MFFLKTVLSRFHGIASRRKRNERVHITPTFYFGSSCLQHNDSPAGAFLRVHFGSETFPSNASPQLADRNALVVLFLSAAKKKKKMRCFFVLSQFT